jgi:hypothetical protein
MLILVTFFLISLVVSTIAIWLYRFISNWEGFNQLTVGNSAKNTRRSFGTQQGYIRAASSTRRRAKSMMLPAAGNSIKTPWGW